MTSPLHPGRSCRDFVATISDYIDEELTPARCRELEAHLAECPCCDRFVGSLRRAVHACRAAGQTRLPAHLQRRAQARVRRLLAAAVGTERSGQPERKRARGRR